MKGKEFILNTKQLEDAVKDFVHDFCLEKHDIDSQSVLVEPDLNQIKKIENMTFPEKGRPVGEVIKELENEIFKYSGRTGKEIPFCCWNQEPSCIEDLVPDRCYNHRSVVRSECCAFDWYADVR